MFRLGWFLVVVLFFRGLGGNRRSGGGGPEVVGGGGERFSLRFFILCETHRAVFLFGGTPGGGGPVAGGETLPGFFFP